MIEITTTSELPVTDLACTIGVFWVPQPRSFGREGEYNSLLAGPPWGAELFGWKVMFILPGEFGHREVQDVGPEIVA